MFERPDNTQHHYARGSRHEALASLLVIAVVATGCADESAAGDPFPQGTQEQPEAGSGEVASLSQAVRGGSGSVKKHSVVELRVNNSQSCTGVMISSRYMLTAAHCVANSLGGRQEGWVVRHIMYYDPDSSAAKRTVSYRDPDTDNHWLYAWVHPNYTGPDDSEDDLALLVNWDDAARRKSPWRGTSSEDYAEIGLGSCSQIDRNTFYGAGFGSFAGGDNGVLRSMSWNTDWCGRNHFIMNARSAQVCRGDSGGPHLRTLSGSNVVVGVHSSSEKASGGSQLCTEGDGKQRSVRLNRKIAWIEQIMSAQGDTPISGGCTRISRGDHPVARCF